MPRFLCPNFDTLSEFIPSSTGEKSHGDCGWLALLLALHCYDAGRYPLNGDGLASVRDDAIRNGYAEANGAVNIPNLDRYLTDHHIPHTTVGYDQYTLDGLHTLLKSYATGFLQPVIIECSSAGRLPEDEAGVQYHYYTMGGIDTDIPCYFRGDGDAVKYNAWPGFKSPIQTSWDEIVASGPIARIVIHGAPGAPTGGLPVALTIETDSAGKVTGAHDDTGSGKHIGEGFALAASQDPKAMASHIIVEEQHIGGQQACVVGTILGTWNPVAGVMFRDWAEAADVVATQANEISQLKQQLQQAQQAQGNAVDRQIAVGLKSLLDLSAQVK